MRIYVDADACPVKEEVVRVATRHAIPVVFVANSWMRLPESPLVERVVVSDGPDAADHWIAERVGAGDIVVTQDIPLASRTLSAGARALSPQGKAFTDANIGMSLAMRDLMKDLREAGVMDSRNPSFTRAGRSTFLQTLESIIQALKRGR
ncbi:MAG: YaiI/YqxD family protein [Pseudomonadota bacterium]